MAHGSHLGWYVLRAKLSLDMCIIELTDEGIGPRLAGMNADMHVVLPMPFPPLCISHGQGVANGC